ncbi:hypothetical protein QYE76_004913 [Lolium multiflorum]|uniref:Reverse transcriptase domain-containing protein n=1 Tax=Lolium multiflorum TaxID=4521 RepID=A0AAD8RRM2_LOLMU|nr:hypothetical protein QYE76_004913 [Lolium multiflorum]
MGELLTEHDGGGGVDGDGFRGHFPVPAGCRDRDFCPPNWSFAMVAAPLESFWSFVKRSNVDPNNVPLASLVAQEENVDVNFIKNNNFNNNAYRNNSGNNYRPYPSANGNGYGNSYGNSYNNNRSVPSGLEAMLKEFISTQTAFNKSVEEKLDKIDTIASRVDRLASDVNLLKLKVMPNNDIDNKITTTANAIQVRINENIRLMAELRARWDREENEKLAKENNVAKVWTITTTSNANSSHVAAPPTINGKIIGVGNVSTPSAKRTKLPEIAKTAETACDKTAEIFSNLGNNDPIAVAHNDLDFDDCHISEVIKFLQKLAKSPNASAINLAFTKHITNALIKAREEKLKLETSIPRKLEDGWEPIIKMKFNDFECNALCDLGASISVMPKKIYDMLDLPPLKNCYLDVNLADNVKKKPLGRIDNVHITMDGREGEKKRLLQETGFSSGTCAVPDEKKHRVKEVSQFDGRFEDESQFDAPVDGTDDEPFIDEGPAPEIIQSTEGGRGPSTQLCVEVDARPEIITGVRVVSRPPSPDAPVDGTDDEPLIDEGPAPEIIQPTEGGRGPSTQLCVEEDAHPEIIRGVPVVSGPPSPDAKC